MARIAKSGLEYFPFDIDFFQDIRIRKLIKRQGGKAVTIYALLLCLIYKNGYYIQWDDELPFICSETSGFDEAYISEVIKTCLALGLFDKKLFDSEKVLSSKGIQIRYRDIQHLNRRMGRIDEYSLIDNHSKTSHRKQDNAHASEPRKPKEKKSPESPQPKPSADKPSEADDAAFLKLFFAESRRESLNLLCKSLRFDTPDFSRLRTLADAVIAEWKLSDIQHSDYSDWSRHLISTMRIKCADDAARSKQTKQTKQTKQIKPSAPKPPTSADYSFNGGFGGKDV